ncbi:hypothetical protein BDV32DRAFT_145349 [Aspergillus pseudonomiae]|nr:hypothetical protein BDV32DRAFT_145349 [Aspergillus pseudonomiae]
MTNTNDMYPTSTTLIQTIGLREMCQVNGRHFKRRKGTEEWIEDEPENTSLPPIQPQPLYLSLVHEKQEHMTYEPSDGKVDITSSEPFLTLYQLASLTEGQAMVVKAITDHETPPHAVNRREVKEKCQGWAVRVLGKLVEEGIVSAFKLDMAKSMMQPV